VVSQVPAEWPERAEWEAPLAETAEVAVRVYAPTTAMYAPMISWAIVPMATLPLVTL
jgi:hypothetical protein